MTTPAALGTHALGTGGVASSALHDLPTVVLVAPTGTVSSGGPNLTTSWTYAQAQGDLQGFYRVVLTNDAGTTTHYDSGWINSSASSHAIDLIALGIPVETTDISVTVLVRSALGAPWEATTGLQPFAIAWGVVTCVVTLPADGAVIIASTTNVTWSFASTHGFTQGAYRVRLAYTDTGVTIHDSGWQTSASTTYPLPYTLSDGSEYTTTVDVANSQGVVGQGVSAWQTDLGVASTFTDLPTVGTVYEIGINGVGYMLADDPADPQKRYQRVTQPLDPQRLATSETPFSESIERYIIAAAFDFKAGAGQKWRDRPSSSPDAIWDCLDVNPFEAAQVTLLNSTAREITSAYANLRLAVAGGNLYCQTAAATLGYRTAPGGSTTSFSIAAATTIESLATDGAQWYAAAGAAGIFRGTTTDPGPQWSAQQAHLVGWAGGRLCAAVTASGSTPNRFTTLTDAGVEEVASGRLTLAEGWTITGFTGGSGHVWLSAYAGDTGSIYAWDLTAAAPFVALELPKGETPMAIRYYQGQVIVLARRVVTSSLSRMAVYRCVAEASGTLIPTLVTVVGEPIPTHDYAAVPAISAEGRFIIFSWPYIAGSDSSGVGALDLSTGGYARWYRATAGGQVASVDVWQGRTVFAVRGDGVWLRSTTGYATSGWVQPSIADGGSSLMKAIDQVTLVAQPLAASESIDVETTIDGGTSFIARPTASMTGAGVKTKTTDLDLRSMSIGLKLTLRGPGTSTPTLHIGQIRYHGIGYADTLVSLPINCADRLTGLFGQELDSSGEGTGANRARSLEGLMQTLVRFQDIDWHLTRVSETYEVVQIQIENVSVFDRKTAGNALGQVATVQLRRKFR